MTNIGVISRTINTTETNPQLTAARRTTSILQACIDECERGLTLPREKLFEQFPEIFRQEEHMAMLSKKDTMTWVSIGCMLLGCVAMGLMKNAGVAHSIVSLAGIGTLAGSWIGAPILAKRVLKKWVLPADIEKRMRHKLEYNKRGFELGLHMEQGRLAFLESLELDELKQTITENIIKVKNGPKIVIPDDDSGFVIIDGIRLNIRDNR